MPSISQQRNYYPATRTDTNSGYVSSLGIGTYLSVYQMSKDDTVKRRKPVDLFANGTARNAFQRSLTSGVASWKENRQLYNVPVLLIGSTGQGAAYTAPPLTICDGQLRKKIKNSNLNLAQSLAEYKQASSMFGSLAIDVVKTFRSLRSGRAIRDFVRILKSPRSKKELEIANRWLQYQYGIRPLMQDLYGSAEALATAIRTGTYKYANVSKTESYNYSDNRVSPGYPGVQVSSFGNYRYTVRARARFKIRDATLKQLSQIGITNPLLLAWELIPYSFVIDWLIPVGDWLSSLDSLVGVEELLVVRSQQYSKTAELVVYGSKASDIQSGYYRAQPDKSLALPRLRYEPSTSLRTVVNGLALLLNLSYKRYLTNGPNYRPPLH